MLQLHSGLKHLIDQQRSNLGVSGLDEVRALIKNFWRSPSLLHRKPGDWLTAAVPESLWEEGHGGVGYFAPLSKLDEPQSLPRAPAQLKTAYPICGSAFSLSFHLAQLDDLKNKNHLGILEAPVENLPITPSLLFVPALLADIHGHRIGRGAGYYDRYLAAHPSTQTVGVLHSDYVSLAPLPPQWLKAHDCRLSALLTENDFFWCKEIST